MPEGGELIALEKEEFPGRFQKKHGSVKVEISFELQILDIIFRLEFIGLMNVLVGHRHGRFDAMLHPINLSEKGFDTYLGSTFGSKAKT